MKKIILLLSLSLAWVTAYATFEIRDASHKPVEGYIKSSYAFGEEKRDLYIGSEALISSADVKDAYASKERSAYAVHVEFTNQGSEKLNRITKARIRKQIAFMTDGEVLSAPTIMNALSKHAMITGSFTKEEAESLVKKILNHTNF